MVRRAIDRPEGFEPVERLSAIARHSGSVFLFTAHRLVEPLGREAATVSISVLRRGRRCLRWQVLAAACSAEHVGAEAGSLREVDPELRWDCDEAACRVLAPSLGLSAAAAPVPWRRAAMIPHLLWDGGLAVPRRVALSIEPADVDEDVARLAGVRAGMLVAWPLAATQPEASRLHVGPQPPVAWAEPAMRSHKAG